MAFLGACNQASEEPLTPSPDEVDDEIYEPVVFRNDEKIAPAMLLRQYQDNPNRFLIDNEEKSFLVEGKIQRVTEFRKPIAEMLGFHVPILTRDPRATWVVDERVRRANGVGPIDSLSIWLPDFTVEQAAKLEIGQSIRASCERVRAEDEGLDFDNAN